MMNVCPKLMGFNQDIFAIQGDQNPLNHWVYELRGDVNPFAYRMNHWIRHYDGVNVLLQNRAEVGSHYVPEIYNAGNPRRDYPSEVSPGHYHHNWRFNNIYETKN